MELIQKRPHLIYLDIARFFAIYWVVLIQHNCAPYHKAWGWVGDGEYFFNPIGGISKYVTAITMPLCFFVSGFILEYGKKIERLSFTNFGVDKFKRLIVPCYIFGGVFSLLQTGTLSSRLLMGFSHLWFLFDLFVFFLGSYFLLKWKNRAWHFGLLCTAFVVLYLSRNLLHSGFLSTIVYYYIWFLFGYIASIWINVINNKVVVLLLALGCCYVILSFFVNRGEYWDFYPLFVLPLVLIIFRMCSKIKNIENSKIFKTLNTTSYGVYIFHMIFLYLFYRFFIVLEMEDFLINSRYCLSSILAVATIPLSIAITILLKKIGFLKI